jgi:hypothetical protein
MPARRGARPPRVEALSTTTTCRARASPRAASAAARLARQARSSAALALHVVVVDNASTDGSLEGLARLRHGPAVVANPDTLVVGIGDHGRAVAQARQPLQRAVRRGVVDHDDVAEGIVVTPVTPALDVVIVNWNGGALLRACLASLAAAEAGRHDNPFGGPSRPRRPSITAPASRIATAGR